MFPKALTLHETTNFFFVWLKISPSLSPSPNSIRLLYVGFFYDPPNFFKAINIDDKIKCKGAYHQIYEDRFISYIGGNQSRLHKYNSSL